MSHWDFQIEVRDDEDHRHSVVDELYRDVLGKMEMIYDYLKGGSMSHPNLQRPTAPPQLANCPTPLKLS